MANDGMNRAVGGVSVSAAVGWLVAAGCATGVDQPNGAAPPPPTVIADAGDSALRPFFGWTVTATQVPPPISGGTLLVTRDGTRAVAADPDRDQVYVVDLQAKTLLATVVLQPGDEPGRAAEDGSGRIHVALRAGGALVTIDPVMGAVLSRRSVCVAPRGVAWDASTDLVWVACATGELVAFPAAGGAATQSFVLQRDLRDVVISQGALAVTTFRSAQVLRVASDGTLVRTDALQSPVASFVPHVAWRAIGGPSGTLIAAHQAESTQSLVTQVQGGYGSGQACDGFSGFAGAETSAGSSSGSNPSVRLLSPAASAGASSGTIDFATNDGGAPPDAGPLCLPAGVGSGWTGFPANPNQDPQCGPAAVTGALTVLAADGTTLVNVSFPGVLPVDVAVSPDGSTMAAVAAGNAMQPGVDTIFLFDGCGAGLPSGQLPDPIATAAPVAIAFDAANDLVVQTREPADLVIFPAASPVTIPSEAPSGTIVALSPLSRRDTGHDIFHTQAGGMIACASCHPEGRDDGHVWTLDGDQRRTPSLLGTIAGTAPYHWPGDQPSLEALVADVYSRRMNGASLAGDQMGALSRWVQALPAPPAPRPAAPDAVVRGQALFERADVGCATCHSGPKFTNNATVNVGTGGRFQVPPLVGVAWRTPLLHDGCAATLEDRFGRCGTPGHGFLGGLSTGDLGDLIAYLSTL